jgi:hypothetical protein
MTKREVLERVRFIKSLTDDDEAAHSEQDVLYEDILKSIADGTCNDPKACAAAALRVQRLPFHRWAA